MKGFTTPVLVLSILLVFIGDASGFLYFVDHCFITNVAEDVKMGTSVYKAQAKYQGRGTPSIFYRIENTDAFFIDHQGNVFTHRKLDYEDDNKLAFLVIATTADGSRAALKCTVILTDVNDEFPQFTNQTYRAVIPENSPMNFIVFPIIEVTDKDIANQPISVTCEKTKTSIDQLQPGEKHPCDIFAIRTKSKTNQNWKGLVLLINPGYLDYERKIGSGSNIFSIPARAFDGKNFATESLIVEISDIQDTPPIITRGKTESVMDGLPRGSHITDVVARDGDTGNPRKLCYKIINGAKTYLTFADPRKPAVTTTQVLDRETIGNTFKNSFQVCEIIPQTDKCSTDPKECATSDIRVNIQDTNDNAPYFDPDRMTTSLSERTQVGAPIPMFLIYSYDKDIGDNAKYDVSILQYGDIFRITPTNVPTGHGIHSITLKKKLDYDSPAFKKQYVLPLLARETLTAEKRTGTATVTINLVDVNDNTPKFDQKRYVTEIPEDTPIGKPVITITATDPDSKAFGKAGIVYELIGTGTEKFNINRRTGEVTVANCSPKPGEGNCIDYEVTKKYSLSVVAKDDNGNPKANQIHTELIINILDVNDNSPFCVHPSYESSMLETSLNPDPPLKVKAKDRDSSRSGNNAIQYSIIAGNNLNYFMISSNGDITARNRVDYETAPNNGVFQLTIQVKDAKFQSKCAAIVRVLDVNDNTPVFENSNYKTSIPETTPPLTEVLTVSATDKDKKTSPNGKILYRIEDGSAGKFSIDENTGKIIVANAAKFDYDVKKQYLMRVVAVDKGVPSKSGTATVTVNILDKNNKSPVLIPSTIRKEVWENATIGTFVTKLKAVDPDSNAKLEYDFIKTGMKAYLSGRVQVDTTKYPLDKLFRLDRTTGQVFTNQKLDYEKAAEIEIPIRVTDVSATTLQTGTGTLYIRVLDINENDPVFIDTEKLSFPHYNISFQEELPVGTYIITMVAIDADSSEISAYKMIDDGKGFFAIQEKTGVVTIKKRVDYEKIQKLKFSVMAYDVGVPIRSASATVFATVINMNDMNPQFNQTEYKASIFEHSKEDTYVTTVKATDLDLEDYGVVRYTMTDKRFKVDPVTGVMRVAKGAVLDRELTPIINVKVEAYDSPKQAKNRNHNYVSVVITLLDINDNPPKFDEQNYYAQITENTPVTTSVLQLRASDADSTCNCKNGWIRYTKIKGSGPGDVKDFFSVNYTTGLITVKKSLVGESYSHKFMVVARDGAGSGKYSVSASVTISVIDANNKPPEFIRPPRKDFTITVLENQYLGLLVYRVRAIDPDGDLNSPITYGFRVNNRMVDRTKEFRINNITGQIRAERVFDREETEKYLLHVSAADHGVPSFITTIDLVVLILDVDDNLPEFPKFTNGSVISYSFSVAEDARKNTMVGKIAAVDKDTKASTLIKYSIVNGNINEAFRIESKNNIGILYTNSVIDREERESYELLVRASNRASSYNLNTRRKRAVEDGSATVVRISVVDVNDNKPQFVLPDYRACVASNAPFSKPVLNVLAKDKDTGKAGKVFYSMRNIKNINYDGSTKDTPKTFIISKLNGTIYTNSLFNQYGKTYFDIQLVGYNDDSTKTEGTSNARVYVTESATRVKVSIKRPPDEVNRYIKDYKRVIADSLSSKVVCVEDIRYHINDENIIEVDKADLIAHVVDTNQNAIYSADDVVKAMEAASKGKYLSDYKVLFIFSIKPVEAEKTEFSLHPVFIIMCIIAVILLVALILLGLICFFLNRQYKREMTKAKYVNEGPLPVNTSTGGTVNPLWSERMEAKGFSQDSGDTAGRSQEPALPAM